MAFSLNSETFSYACMIPQLQRWDTTESICKFIRKERPHPTSQILKKTFYDGIFYARRHPDYLNSKRVERGKATIRGSDN